MLEAALRGVLAQWLTASDALPREWNGRIQGVFMIRRKLIVNLGLARCGTTATDDYFRALPGFSTPLGVKELKFFLRPRKPSEYLGHFAPSADSILFESSPPYMHGGLDTFRDVIGRISAFRDQGFDVYLLVNIRNLLKRAFSHYWHDISGHHSIFGKYWSVSKTDDPRRFSTLYDRSFVEELTKADAGNKFLPDIGQMLQHAVSVMGADRVRIVLTSRLDSGIDAFLREVAPDRNLPVTKTRRVPGKKAPVYLYGGETGATFMAALPQGMEEVRVPAHCCVLFARRHQELLLGTTYDLKRITDAARKWTKSLPADAIPQAVADYLATQHVLLESLPPECFLDGCRDEALEKIFTIPPTLSVKTPVPTATEVKKLVWQR